MKKNGLLIKRKHYKVVTTQSDHNYKKYPNRVKDFIPMGTEQLWVSDMTIALMNNITKADIKKCFWNC